MNTDHPDFPQPGAFRWTALGYDFQLPASLDLAARGDVISSDPWISLLAILEKAKTGDFSEMIRAVDCMDVAENWVLLRGAAALLGDAGSSSCLRSALDKFRPYLYDDDDIILQVEFSHSLWGSMFLWTAPVLADLYLRSQDRKESAIIAIKLAELLGSEYIPFPEKAGTEDEKWREKILLRYNELKARFGSDEVPVFRGEVFDLRRVATEFLKGLKSGEAIDEADLTTFRHQFEASTGIGCREMFKENKPQPLAVAALLEKFLKSPAAAKFEAGARYFFGHRILG